MISKYFIDRPIFSSVIAIVIVIAGLVTLRTLPVAQYPDITPPVVQVSASYIGADAESVNNSVAVVLCFKMLDLFFDYGKVSVIKEVLPIVCACFSHFENFLVAVVPGIKAVLKVSDDIITRVKLSFDMVDVTCGVLKTVRYLL